LRKAGYGLGGIALTSAADSGVISSVPARTIRAGVGAETLVGKVLCGYQGWFRCPGDPTGAGWRHWSRSASRIAPETLTFDMWPDLSEYSDAELYPAPGFTYPDGSPASLFSSAHPLAVNRHFDWQRDYGNCFGARHVRALP
jgi:hypothetical protein